MIKQMEPGSVIVDVSIDQGGCVETARADLPRQPDLRRPRRHPLHGREHAGRGAAHVDLRADQRDDQVRRHARRPRPREGDRRRPRTSSAGINTYKGAVPHAAVAEALGVPHDAVPRLSSPRPVAARLEDRSPALGKFSGDVAVRARVAISGTIATWAQVDTPNAGSSREARGVRAPGARPHRRAVRRGLPADAQPARRRGPGPGLAAARVPVLGLVRAGLELQGVAAAHRDQHVHQRVPAQEAQPRGARRRERRAGRDRWRARPRGAPATRQTPERALLDRSVSDDVQRALEALPDDFRTAVVLCDVQGLSYKEIAEIMQTPGRHRDEPAVPRPQAARGRAARVRAAPRATFATSRRSPPRTARRADRSRRRTAPQKTAREGSR